MPTRYEDMKFGPQKRNRMGVYIKCPQCGREFYLIPKFAKEGRKYCSRTCYDAAHAPELVAKTCLQCGNTFQVSAAIANRYTVCSRACRVSETKYTICERCGKVFVAEKRLNRHYCSEECRRPPVFRACDTCGVSFRMLPSDIDRRFCSLSCYHKTQGETSIEKKVRLALTALGVGFTQEARMGRYSVDFILPALRLALEVDGKYWHRDVKRDTRKTSYLNSRGWQVLRIGEDEINDTLNHENLIAAKINGITDSNLPDLQPSLF